MFLNPSFASLPEFSASFSAVVLNSVLIFMGWCFFLSSKFPDLKTSYFILNPPPFFLYFHNQLLDFLSLTLFTLTCFNLSNSSLFFFFFTVTQNSVSPWLPSSQYSPMLPSSIAPQLFPWSHSFLEVFFSFHRFHFPLIVFYLKLIDFLHK